jgi:putative spermidine/putrescine transport system ATP-binding protein
MLDTRSQSTARPSQAKATSSPFLVLCDLCKSYGDALAVDRLNLEIEKGELVAFLGPSGCGKTTSLRVLAGLTPASSGQIIMNGQDLTDMPPYRRDMGLVFQSYALFPHLDVARNVAFGLEMRKVPRGEIATRVAEAIALVRLTGLEHRRPSELSGGQQQRVALARALVIRPSILLFDEPLSNLDAKLRDEMRTEIRDIQQRLGITSVFVTHDQVEALTMCDRIAVINHGRLEQFGSPEDLYERPASAFVASFVGRSNKLTGLSSGNAIRVGSLDLLSLSRNDGPVEVMIRPHRIAIDAALPQDDGPVNRLAGEVVRSIYAGDLIQTEVRVADTVFSVEQSNVFAGRTPGVGSAVTLSFLARDTLVFPAAS